jgi:hypothetical protein
MDFVEVRGRALGLLPDWRTRTKATGGECHDRWESTSRRCSSPTQLDNEVIGLDEILSSAPEPDIDGGIELTDKEFAAFLEAALS